MWLKPKPTVMTIHNNNWPDCDGDLVGLFYICWRLFWHEKETKPTWNYNSLTYPADLRVSHHYAKEVIYFLRYLIICVMTATTMVLWLSTVMYVSKYRLLIFTCATILFCLIVVVVFICGYALKGLTWYDMNELLLILLVMIILLLCSAVLYKYHVRYSYKTKIWSVESCCHVNIPITDQ